MREGKISGLLVMVVMILGLAVLAWVLARLILERFKSDEVSWLKYDMTVVICTYLLIISFYINFFGGQFLKYRGMEYAPVIPWVFLCGVLPFNIVTSLICGIKGKWIIVSTLMGTVVSLILFIITIGVI